VRLNGGKCEVKRLVWSWDILGYFIILWTVDGRNPEPPWMVETL
jgi:hypothetical protein